MRYKLEWHGPNGWVHAAEFKDGEPYRDGTPIDHVKMIGEAKDYKVAWPNRIVRLIVIIP